MHYQWVLIYDKHLKHLICLGYWRTKQWKSLVWTKEARANVNLMKSLQSWRGKRIFMKWSFCVVCKFCLDFMLHEQKYNVKSNFKVPSFNVNLSLCQFRLSENPFQNNENCESSITTIYQSKISKIYIR